MGYTTHQKLTIKKINNRASLHQIDKFNTAFTPDLNKYLRMFLLYSQYIRVRHKNTESTKIFTGENSEIMHTKDPTKHSPVKNVSKTEN